MTYDDDDRQGEALDEMFREWLPGALRERAEESAWEFLATFGDTIQERVESCVSDAGNHLSNRFYEASIIRSFTAAEITVGYLLFRPLFPGLLLSEEFADRLIKEVFDGNSRKEGELLPHVLNYWGLDTKAVLLPTGQPMWETLTGPVRRKRNAVVHRGARATQEDAAVGLMAAKQLISGVVFPLASTLGFQVDQAGRWFGDKPYSFRERPERRSPFKE